MRVGKTITEREVSKNRHGRSRRIVAKQGLGLLAATVLVIVLALISPLICLARDFSAALFA
jgi:hypothetical protein